MKHAIIDQVLLRAENAKSDGDFSHFFALLLAAEALMKATVLGLVSMVEDDKDRNRYRLEHALVKADGLGEWGRAIDDVLTGTASQYLVSSAREEQTELTCLCRSGDWQYDSVFFLKEALIILGIESEDVPVKSDMKRWFRLFATLRNKTRAHGATQPGKSGRASEALLQSINLFYSNHRLFKRQWAYLHRNLSGKYRVSEISGCCDAFSFLKKSADFTYKNGVYIFADAPRMAPLIESDAELDDFYFSNGGFSGKKFELLSYCTDNKADGDATIYQTPPGTLPVSESQGHGELLAMGNCHSNAPKLIKEYVSRPKLEVELKKLLSDDKYSIITLIGKGGIGKTSLALKVIPSFYDEQIFDSIVWFSARDVDLQLSGPKPVRRQVFSAQDISEYYSRLVLSNGARTAKGFNAKSFFESQLNRCDVGPTLFIFDNFETTQNPIDTYNWIETYVRLPNKVLITTRLRDFKGDYPIEVRGMEDTEAQALVKQTAIALNVAHLMTTSYVDGLIKESAGHPYIIKILLGEVCRIGRTGSISQIVAGSDEILTALFERTYASLSPCAQRAFMTLSAWNSSVPRIAFEAVLQRSTKERQEVEAGIESLLKFSMAEINVSEADSQEFIGLPLVASVFGKKKLNVSPFKISIVSDVEILQMLGTTQRCDITLGLAKRVDSLISNISRKVDTGSMLDEYAPILEMICRSYTPGWIPLAKMYAEFDLIRAKSAIQRFLEVDPDSELAAEAWRIMANICYRLGDPLGEIHAFIERAQITSVAFYDLSSTASRLNQLLRDHALGVDAEEKRQLANRIASSLHKRRSEADATDFSRMAWLALQMGNENLAREYVDQGMLMDDANFHCLSLNDRLNIRR